MPQSPSGSALQPLRSFLRIHTAFPHPHHLSLAHIHHHTPDLEKLLQTPEAHSQQPTDILTCISNRCLKLFLKKDFIYLFIFRERGKEEEREKHQCVVATHMPPTGDLACNPDMCPDWESNPSTRWFTGQRSIH